MTIYICQKCQKEIVETQAILYEGGWYCPICRKSLSYFGQEAALLTQEGEAVAQKGIQPVKWQLPTFDSKQVNFENPQSNILILEYEDALKLNPHNTHALLGLARVAKTQNQISKAIELLNQVVELQSDLIPAFKELYEIYTRQSDLERAFESLLKLKELDSRNYWVAYQLALSYEQKGDLNAALAFAIQSFDLCEDDAIKPKIDAYIKRLSISLD